MEKIKQLQQDFAEFLANTDFNGQPKELYEPISYTLLQSGKRPGKIDQQYMKLAEKLLYGELAIALEVPIESIQDYITHRLETKE